MNPSGMRHCTLCAAVALTGIRLLPSTFSAARNATSC